MRQNFKAWNGQAALWVLEAVPLPADILAYPAEDFVARLLGPPTIASVVNVPSRWSPPTAIPLGFPVAPVSAPAGYWGQ